MSVDLPEHQQARHEPQMFHASTHKPDGYMEPAAEVGYFLQREREARALSIEAASEATGIHPYHIDAIERGDLTHMPPRLEAMEMIAGYAQYLGFEPEPLIEHLFTFLPPPPITPKAFHPAQPPVLSSAKVLRFGKMPKIPSFNIRIADYPGGARGLVTSVSAALVLFVGAHFALSGHPGSPAPAAEQTASAAPQPAPDAAPVASAQADVKASAQPLPEGDKIASAGGPVPDEADAMGAFIQDQTDQPAAGKGKSAKVASTKIQDRIKIEDQIKTASTNPIPQPSDGRTYGAENKDARVVLKALAPVWLRVEDQQGVAVMTQMLNTGDSYRVPNRDGLVALSRDGGRLAFMIDGQEKGVLGPPGKILVSEKLDVAALQTKK